jgi:hypothetical protein
MTLVMRSMRSRLWRSVPPLLSLLLLPLLPLAVCVALVLLASGFLLSELVAFGVIVFGLLA